MSKTTEKERSQGGKGRSQGSKDGKKKRRVSEETSGVAEGDQKRKQGNEETRKKKKKKKRENGTERAEPKETTEGNEKRRRDNGMERAEPKATTEGNEKRKKKRRRENRTERAEQETTEGNEATEGHETTEGNEMRKKGRKQKDQAQQTIRVEMKQEVDDVTDTNQETQNLSSELVELEEFIPDIRRKSKEVIQRLLTYDLKRFREFKKKGLKLHWGRYSMEENLQIRRNVEDFLKLTHIQTPEELFFPQRFPEQERNLKELKTRHHFYKSIAEGLRRTCEQVYIRARKMYDPKNHLGRFSEDELLSLQKLHTIYGNNWKLISNQLDRSVYACEKRHSQIGSHHGPWTPEETHRLKRATKKHLKQVLKSSPSPGLDLGPSLFQLCSKIPWKKISGKVQTRSWIQCRAKWFSYLKSRLKVDSKSKKREKSSRIQTRAQLIQTLYEMQVEHVSEVDWIHVAKRVGAVTPMCMQRMYHRMKVSWVPDWSRCSFGEVVDFLFENELPLLLKKLKSPPVPELEPARFSLDCLFPPDEEGFTEVDNT